MISLTRDWADVFSEFAVAYPGLNPLRFTVAVFEAYANRATKNRAYLDGRWGDQDAHGERSAQDNRAILLKARLPTFFPDPFADDKE